MLSCKLSELPKTTQSLAVFVDATCSVDETARGEAINGFVGMLRKELQVSNIHVIAGQYSEDNELRHSYVAFDIPSLGDCGYQRSQYEQDKAVGRELSIQRCDQGEEQLAELAAALEVRRCIDYGDTDTVDATKIAKTQGVDSVWLITDAILPEQSDISSVVDLFDRSQLHLLVVSASQEWSYTNQDVQRWTKRWEQFATIHYNSTFGLLR